MNDDAFAKIVAEEVKNKLPQSDRELLLRQENWERWKNALVALVEVLEDQISDIEIDSESDRIRYEQLGRSGKRLAQEAASAYDSKKHKINRFKYHVEKRLDQVVKMMETGEKIDDEVSVEVELLRKSISKHRELLQEYDLEETAIDRALWDSLKGRWTFDSINSSSL
jgi:hypothetical protein